VGKQIIRLGKWSEESLDRLIRQTSLIPDPGPRIEMISKEFLGLPYRGFTLEGDSDTPEAFVIDLEGVDCFTFIDYVEAMRISRSYLEFKMNLARVRYRGGVVAYGERNHFFSDWIESMSPLVRDVTSEVGEPASRRAVRMLNAKGDGTFFLPGIRAKEREICYIPASLIDDSMERRLETGDYVGIYSITAGLDVSHVGIFIRKEDGSFLRHASSADETRKVVDQNFRSYVAAKPGIVIFRPLTQE
jgi:hypothetical protein